MNLDTEIIRFWIAWGPTILFITIITTGILLGIWRGLRKSLVLLLHSVIVATICISLYVIVININNIDSITVSLVNKILGPNKVQELFGVNSSCDSLKTILIEYIPKKFSYGDALSLVLMDNGAYLATVIDVGYHLIFALIFLILYWILIFLSYIIYLIFYPERRYKKKKFKKSETNISYQKRRVLGGVTGGLRSLIAGIVSLSFIGMLFFVVAGTGERKEQEISFGNEDYDTIYDIYQAVGSYGQTGIFKVLNTVKDKDDVPYYLFAADLVFQGGLVDENKDINQNIYLREELSAYVSFARDTFDLLMKYDTNDAIKKIILDPSSGDMMDAVLEVIALNDFSIEFSKMITQFEEKTFIINFSLSLIDSIVRNINTIIDVDSFDQEALDIIAILFTGEDSIKVSDLVNRNDVNEVLNLCLSIFADYKNDKDTKTEKIISYTKRALPVIRDLSILKPNNKKLNNMLNNIYQYVLNNTLNTSNQVDVSANLKSANLKSENINWVYELDSLLDMVPEAITLYNNVYKDREEESIETILFDYLFPKGNSNISKINEKALDKIIYSLGNSKILGLFLSSNDLYNLIEEQFSENINASFPNSISYANTYDANGKLIAYGEAHNVLTVIKVLIKNDAKSIYDLLSSDTSSSNLILNIDSISNKLNTPVSANGSKTVLDCLIESDIINYSLTSILLNTSFNDVEYMKLYIPNECIETITTDQYFHKIKTKDLRNLFETLPLALDLLKPVINNPDNISAEIPNLLKDNKLISILKKDSIIEATMSNIVLNMLSTEENIVLTQSLLDVEEWISVKENNKIIKNGELLSLVVALNETNIDLSELISNTDGIIDKIMDWDLSEDSIELLLESKMLYYNISFYVMDTNIEGTSIVVPNSALDTDLNEYKQSGEKIGIIKKDEIIYLLVKAFNLLKDEINVNILLRDLSEYLENDILHATIVLYLVNTLKDDKILKIPSTYLASATKERLKYEDNIWYTSDELIYFINALDEILDIENNEIDINNINKDELLKDIFLLNDSSRLESDMTRLEVCFRSAVIKATLTSQIDNLLVEQNLVDLNASITFLNLGKTDNCYTIDHVSYLIETCKVLEITDFQNIDIKEIENSILTLNEPYENDLSHTKLEVIYKSNISIAILSKQLDNALTGVISNYALENSKDNYIYSYLEISSLINAAQELEIDNLSNINIKQFQDSVLKLNEISVLNSSKTRLDIVYESVIIQNIITEELDKLLMPSIINENQSFLIKNNNTSYSKTEISSLIKSFSELEITDISNINNETLTENISKLNDKSNDPTFETKLDLLFESKIIGFAITNKLDSTFEPMVSRGVIEKVKEEGIYKKSEIKNILMAFEELDIENINNIDLKDKLFSLNERSTANPELTKLDILFETNILKSIFTYKIDEALASNDDIVIDPEAKEVYADTMHFKKEEIEVLINAMNKINKETADIQFDDISFDSEMKDYIFKSKILYATVSKQIAENSILIVPLTACSSINIIKIKEEELTMLFDLMGDKNIKDIDIKLNHGLINQVYESEILNATFSDIIVYNDNLVVPISECIPNSKDYSNKNIVVINKDSVKILLESLFNGLKITDLNNIPQSITFDDLIIDYVYDSSILNATISTRIIEGNVLTIPQADYIESFDYRNKRIGIIEKDSLYLLLQAITKGLEIEEVTDIESSNILIPSMENRKYIFNSSIMRATISQNIEANGKKVYIENNTDYVEKTKDYRGKDILIISKNELQDLMNSIGLISDSNEFKINLNINSLFTLAENINSMYKILESNIVNILISDLVISTNKYNEPIFNSKNTIDISNSETIYIYELIHISGISYSFKSPTNISVYSLANAIEQQKDFLSIFDIVAFFTYYKNFGLM